MTDHEMNEMRRQLAWAQGWTEITTGSDGDLYGSPPGTADPDEWDTVPDPLEDDCDAALLRAWCVERGWTVRTDNEPASEWVHGGAWPAAHVKVVRAPIVESSLVREREEPDPCRRERLALCRAVLAVLEAGGDHHE